MVNDCSIPSYLGVSAKIELGLTTIVAVLVAVSLVSLFLAVIVTSVIPISLDLMSNL